MTKKTKIKNAAKNINNRRANSKTQNKTFWGRVWNVICMPFRFIAKVCRKIWNMICKINLVGLVNSALLVAIIVLFSMLIIDVMGCKKEQIIIVPEKVPVTKQVTVTEDAAPHVVRMRKTTLPLQNSKKSADYQPEPINVVPVKKAEAKIAKQQTPQYENKFMGDVIIDSRASGAMLKNNSQVNGNLYLQNMRKYVLPCDIRINGNLFLRDVNMLQFCGDFVITGNIYVSPRSSFGPIPKTARLGGQVVL
ncbi:MAG: hypothetical protein J6K82_02845 [Alphaproteobacteria bacterium]|nr:hypothetical protein [Alphaproteobacteria bacterium]